MNRQIKKVTTIQETAHITEEEIGRILLESLGWQEGEFKWDVGFDWLNGVYITKTETKVDE